MVRAYFRCNSGHYFTGSTCPIDGWTSGAATELFDAVEQLVSARQTPTLERLRSLRVGSEALLRAIIIEFGNAESAFDAVSPEGYVIDGEWKPLDKLDWRFK